MISLYIWILLVKEAFGSISIEVEPSFVAIGKSDIDIRCIVNDTEFTKIFNIQLIRSNETVVDVTRVGVGWKDAALQNKIEITVNASITNVMSSYLHLEISKTVVRYPEDLGSYQCSVQGTDSSNGLRTNYSQTVNLTGLHETTIATRDFTTAFLTEQYLHDGTSKSNRTEGTFESNVTIKTSDDNISKVLKTYRAVMIPIGSLISCILAFVIIREIRLYKSATK